MGKTTETRLNRRKMMLVAGGAVAGAGALMAASVRRPARNVARSADVNIRPARTSMVLASAGYDEWMSVVGSSFAVGGSVLIELSGLRPLPSAGSKPQGVRSLAFAAFFDPLNGQTLVPDRIYTAMHSQYGATQIYLAASSDPRTPGRMVAVFN